MSKQQKKSAARTVGVTRTGVALAVVRDVSRAPTAEEARAKELYDDAIAKAKAAVSSPGFDVKRIPKLYAKYIPEGTVGRDASFWRECFRKEAERIEFVRDVKSIEDAILAD